MGGQGSKTNPTYVTFLLRVSGLMSAFRDWKLFLLGKCGIIKLQIKHGEGYSEPDGRHIV